MRRRQFKEAIANLPIRHLRPVIVQARSRATAAPIRLVMPNFPAYAERAALVPEVVEGEEPVVVLPELADEPPVVLVAPVFEVGPVPAVDVVTGVVAPVEVVPVDAPVVVPLEPEEGALPVRQAVLPVDCTGTAPL